MAFNDKNTSRKLLPWSHNDYLQLVDWAGRTISGQKRGAIPESMPPILERVGMELNPVIKYLTNRQQSFNALGPASRLREMAASLGMKFLRGVSLGKQLYPEPG